MSATTEQAAARAVVAEVFARTNAHDADGIGAHVTDDVCDDWPIVGHLAGKPAVLAYFRDLFGALPDLCVRAERVAVEGDTVFVHWHLTGTFSGTPITGLLATGRAIDLRGTDCFTMRHGRIAANFIAYDGMAFAVQAGILPRRGTWADRAMTISVNAATRMRRLLRR
ncbi:MAG: ester cyclase [Thermoleophilia bacterium]